MYTKYLARRARAVAATLAVASAGSPVAAQVVLDGTTGPAGALGGRPMLGDSSGSSRAHSPLVSP